MAVFAVCVNKQADFHMSCFPFRFGKTKTPEGCIVQMKQAEEAVLLAAIVSGRHCE